MHVSLVRIKGIGIRCWRPLIGVFSFIISNFELLGFYCMERTCGAIQFCLIVVTKTMRQKMLRVKHCLAHNFSFSFKKRHSSSPLLKVCVLGRLRTWQKSLSTPRLVLSCLKFLFIYNFGFVGL